MNFKYLLIASCKEDGYWDTSGYCHWHKPAFDYSEEFEKNEEGEKYLTEDLADILHRFPRGIPLPLGMGRDSELVGATRCREQTNNSLDL